MKISGITITHPEKIIFPQKEVTKKDMVSYYNLIASRMLPYLKNRPLTLQRFPDGISENGFFQKHSQDYYPDFIKRTTIENEDGRAEAIMCNNKRTLIYLANHGTVAFHVWSSPNNNLHRPDKIILDLDPSGNATFLKVKNAAMVLGKFLKEKNIDSKPITSGKMGIHVVYPIKPSQDFDKVRQETREIGEQLAEKHPGLFTLEMRKNKRGDKIFFDYLRNSYGQTSICPFSLRPNPNVGVATPLNWNELDKVKSGDQYNYSNIFKRLAAKGE